MITIATIELTYDGKSIRGVYSIPKDAHAVGLSAHRRRYYDRIGDDLGSPAGVGIIGAVLHELAGQLVSDVADDWIGPALF